MNKDNQRIAIAEACGGYEIHYYGTENNGPESDINPLRLVGKRSKQGVGSWAVICSVPDYPTDLNAMHEAEKMLTVKQQHKFAEEVGHIIYNGELSVPDFRDNWYMCYLMMHTTAAQRAEAFLKTIGKWES